MKRKLLMTLATLTTAVAPIATVVSCGKKKDNKVDGGIEVISPMERTELETQPALSLNQIPNDGGQFWSRGISWYSFLHFANSIHMLAQTQGFDPLDNRVTKGTYVENLHSSDASSQTYSSVKEIYNDPLHLLGLSEVKMDGTDKDYHKIMINEMFQKEYSGYLNKKADLIADAKKYVDFYDPEITKTYDGMISQIQSDANWYPQVWKASREGRPFGTDGSLGQSTYWYEWFRIPTWDNTYQPAKDFVIPKGHQRTRGPWMDQESYNANLMGSNVPLEDNPGGGRFGKVTKDVLEGLLTHVNDITQIIKLKTEKDGAQAFQSHIMNLYNRLSISQSSIFYDANNVGDAYVSLTYSGFQNYEGHPVIFTKIQKVTDYNYVGNKVIDDTQTINIYDAAGTLKKVVNKKITMKKVLALMAEKLIGKIDKSTLSSLAGAVDPITYEMLVYLLNHKSEMFDSEGHLKSTVVDKWFDAMNKGSINWSAIYTMFTGVKDLPEAYRNKDHYGHGLIGLKDAENLTAIFMQWAHNAAPYVSQS